MTRNLNKNGQDIVGRAEAASKAGKIKLKSAKRFALLKLAGAAGLGAAAAGVIMKMLG
jgi:hypothetical protein